METVMGIVSLRMSVTDLLLSTEKPRQGASQWLASCGAALRSSSSAG